VEELLPLGFAGSRFDHPGSWVAGFVRIAPSAAAGYIIVELCF